jgi:uncharacterized protein involved in exopolysaccharide biosynthesis
LRDLLTPVFRHKGLVSTVFVAVFLFSVFVAWAWAAKYYVASMQIVVQQHRSDPTISPAQTAAVMNNRGISPDQISSEMALLKGEDMLRSVVETCGLVNQDKWSVSEVLFPRDPERKKAARIEKAATSLAKGLKVEAAKVSDVIDVRYGTVGAPQRPACVLQNLGKLYLEKRLQLQRPAGSSRFFEEQTAKYGDATGKLQPRRRRGRAGCVANGFGAAAIGLHGVVVPSPAGGRC